MIPLKQIGAALPLGGENNQKTRSQAVARIADRTAKNCKGHVT